MTRALPNGRNVRGRSRLAWPKTPRCRPIGYPAKARGLLGLMHCPMRRMGMCQAEFPARLRSMCPGPYHKAQVSITYPGHPKPREGESDAAFQFRKILDAAHVDGILGIGTPKRRFVREPHAYILGMPLNDFDAGASPMVVWEGSHQIMQAAFQDTFGALLMPKSAKRTSQICIKTCANMCLTPVNGSKCMPMWARPMSCIQCVCMGLRHGRPQPRPRPKAA